MNPQHHHTDSPEFEDGSEVIELRIVIKATCGFEVATLTVNETYGQPWGAWLFSQTGTGSKRGVGSLQYCSRKLERDSLRWILLLRSVWAKKRGNTLNKESELEALLQNRGCWCTFKKLARCWKSDLNRKKPERLLIDRVEKILFATDMEA
jgi:hypothetical protein